MAAGEAIDPRNSMPKAFNSVFYRLTVFFGLGSLCVGIVVPYNDPDLLNAISNAHPGAGSSPYVIAMRHLNIPIVPHIMNALILSSVFSAGNSYVFCGSRSLFGLALEGKAPKFLTRCTANGVPIYCVGVTLTFALLCPSAFSWSGRNCADSFFVSIFTALQQCSGCHSMVWFTPFFQCSNCIFCFRIGSLVLWQLHSFSITRSSPSRTFAFIMYVDLFPSPRLCINFSTFQALKAQGISRDNLPHKSFWQPFCGFVFHLLQTSGGVLNRPTQLLRIHWRRYHGARRRLHCVPTRKMGRPFLFVLIYHDCDRSHPLCGLETHEQDKGLQLSAFLPFGLAFLFRSGNHWRQWLSLKKKEGWWTTTKQNWNPDW